MSLPSLLRLPSITNMDSVRVEALSQKGDQVEFRVVLFGDVDSLGIDSLDVTVVADRVEMV